MATSLSVEKDQIVDFWFQITGFDIESLTKEKGALKISGDSSKPFQPVPIDPQLAAELRPFNGFYNLILMSSGPQPPISPNPGPIMPGPVLERGFIMIDRSIEYSPYPVHKICISFKAISVEDITKQIIGPGGFDPATHEMDWSSTGFQGSAIFKDLALSARNSFVTRAHGIFADMPLCGGNQLAPAGLDVFVGNYKHVIGDTVPPCTFNITKTNDGFQCTIKQLSGNRNEIVASSISYNAQMYLLSVPDEQENGLRKFHAMLGTYSNVGLVAYVMGSNADNSPATGFIGINEKPEYDHSSGDDKLLNSALWSRTLMHNAEGVKKKAKKADTAKKIQAPAGVPVNPEIAYAMHPFNGFYSLTGSDLKDDAINWLCIDRKVTYTQFQTLQKGPLYTVQVTYQLNGSSVQQISGEATQHFDPSTNTIRFGQTELKFSTQPLSKDQPTASRCEGQIQTSDGQIVRVSGTNSLTAPDISMYAGNYSYILLKPSKGPAFSLNLYFNQGAFEISITNEKSHKSTVVPQFTYDPQMFTVNIPANPKADTPSMMVMLGTMAPLGCVAYVIIRGKKLQDPQIEFISTNPV